MTRHLSAYRFANEIWVENIIGEKIDRKSISKAALFSIIPWFVGLAISAYNKISLEYVGTPSFYVGSLGVFVTMLGLVYGASQQYRMYERVAAAFDLDQSKSLDHMLKALSRHSSFWQHMRAAAIIFAIGLVAILSGVVFWDISQPISQAAGTNIPRFKVLEQYGWYYPERRMATFFILSTFLLFISAALGTSASIMLRLPVFLWRISGEKPRLPPAVIKNHYSVAATVYSMISLSWLIGVGMVLYFVGSNKDWLSYSFVIFVFLVGIVNLAVPQVAYIRTVSAAEQFYSSIISERFGAPILTDSEVLDHAGHDEHKSFTTSTLALLLKFEDWVYPLHQTYVVVGVYVASGIGTIFGWSKIANLMADWAK